MPICNLIRSFLLWAHYHPHHHHHQQQSPANRQSLISSSSSHCQLHTQWKNTQNSVWGNLVQQNSAIHRRYYGPLSFSFSLSPALLMQAFFDCQYLFSWRIIFPASLFLQSDLVSTCITRCGTGPPHLLLLLFFDCHSNQNRIGGPAHQHYHHHHHHHHQLPLFDLWLLFLAISAREICVCANWGVEMQRIQ